MGVCGSKSTAAPDSPGALDPPVSMSGAKFPIGKLVCIDAPKSVGPPLSDLRGTKGTIKGCRQTKDGRIYSVITNNYMGHGDIQTAEIKEEWLSRAGTVAQSQNVKQSTVLEVLIACDVYRIPTFQRRYCWLEFQWRQLWQSIVNVRDNPSLNNHSLSRLMLLQNHDGSRLVLDGQQRLTTVMLLLSALCNRAQALGDKETVNEYSGFCSEGRLIPTMYDRPDFLRCLMEPKPTGHSSVVRAKCCFTEMAQALDSSSCEEMLETVLNRLSMIAFVVDNQDSMQSIFEKMAMRTEALENVSVDINSCIECYASGDGGKESKSTHWSENGNRLCSECASSRPGSVPMTPGIPMSPVDVIRSFVFDHYDGDDNMKQAYEEFWGPAEAKIGGDTKAIEAGLSKFLTSRGYEVESRWGLTKSFQAWWGRLDNASPQNHATAKLSELLNGVQK